MLNGKIRNPFPGIGKIIKYEFIHASTILLPIYCAMLILGLLVGIFGISTKNLSKAKDISDSYISKDSNARKIAYFPDARSDEYFNASTDIIINGEHYELDMENNNVKMIVGGFLTVIYIIIMCAAFIVTLVILVRRFKTSMLGEEAYMNLSLPVTMFEHIWGRFINNLIWFILCLIVAVVSFFAAFSKLIDFPFVAEGINRLSDSFNGLNVNKFEIIVLCVLNCILTFGVINAYCFCVSSIGHLFKKHRNVAKIAVAVIILIISSRLFNLIPHYDFEDLEHLTSSVITGAWISTGILAVKIAVYMGASHFIFARELNLE